MTTRNDRTLRRTSGIETDTETLLLVGNVPKHLRKVLGRQLHVSAVYRWSQAGIRGVRLETTCIGGRLATSTQALARFFHAVAASRRGT